MPLARRILLRGKTWVWWALQSCTHVDRWSDVMFCSLNLPLHRSLSMSFQHAHDPYLRGGERERDESAADPSYPSRPQQTDREARSGMSLPIKGQAFTYPPQPDADVTHARDGAPREGLGALYSRIATHSAIVPPPTLGTRSPARPGASPSRAQLLTKQPSAPPSPSGGFYGSDVRHAADSSKLQKQQQQLDASRSSSRMGLQGATSGGGSPQLQGASETWGSTGGQRSLPVSTGGQRSLPGSTGGQRSLPGSTGGQRSLPGDEPPPPNAPAQPLRRPPTSAPSGGLATRNSGSFPAAWASGPQKTATAMVRMGRADAWTRFLAYEGCIQVMGLNSTHSSVAICRKIAVF